MKCRLNLQLSNTQWKIVRRRNHTSSTKPPLPARWRSLPTLFAGKLRNRVRQPRQPPTIDMVRQPSFSLSPYNLSFLTLRQPMKCGSATTISLWRAINRFNNENWTNSQQILLITKQFFFWICWFSFKLLSLCAHSMKNKKWERKNARYGFWLMIVDKLAEEACLYR